AFTLNDYFDELLENLKDNSSSHKKIISHRFLAYIQFMTSMKELVNFLVNGTKVSYKLADYYLEKSKRNFLRSFGDFNFLITDMLTVFLIRVKERILFNYIDVNNEFFLKYIKVLQKDGIYEFWPSQIECIKNDIFSSSNFLICAPTSAGKSLMAELAIVHEFANNKSSHCFYVVPSKALANQVTKSLEKHLNSLGIKVFKIVGGQNENFEDLFLKNIKICVITPEKFYQYEKKSHKFFLNSNLIIFDEAHLIGSGFRGLSLEFEIAKLLRKHPKKRIILISAVIRNFDKISSWISKDKKFLFSDWKPTTTINAFLDLNNQLIFFDELYGLKITIPSIKKNDSILKKVATLTYIYHKKLGMTLVFSNTKPNAEKIAKTIYENFKLEDIRNKKDKIKIDLLISIVSKVIGEDYPLIKYLKKGLTFHHASLPDEIRERIEELIQEGIIKIIVATSTLAEGVNTPISCLLVPYINLPNSIKKISTPISKRLFKNIVGRVGRAMINTEGYVIMFETDKLNSEKIKEYLFIETEEIENLNSYLIELTELDLRKSYFTLGDFNFKQNYPLALFQRDLLSVLKDNVYTGDNLDKIMKQTLFNSQVKIQDKIYNNAKELINNSIKTMEKLPIPALVHSSPYRLTAFGELCYNVGLSPVTMNRFLLEIRKIIKDHPNVLKLNDFNRKSDEGLLKKWFSILHHSLEVENDFLDQLPNKLDDIPGIILNWINGTPLSTIRTRFFGDDDKALRNTVDFIQGFIVYYGPWLISAMNEILKFINKDLEIPQFLRTLPNFLMTGTSEWNEMVLISLEICRRNEGSKELGGYFRENDLSGEDLLTKNFLRKLNSMEKINILKSKSLIKIILKV
ncbi:hypothetical protein LCGC14_1264200, partial [marine sediment metagenome]